MSNYYYNLGSLFSCIAQKFSNKPALRTIEGGVFTYLELDELSNRIAGFLIEKGLNRCDVVAIFNNKTNVAYAIMLACIKLGIIYTNIDPHSPVERLRRMIAQCKPLLFFYYYDEFLKAEQSEIEDLESVDYSDAEFTKLCNNYSSDFPVQNSMVTGNTPAYIMFTSGSTGFPKGVVITNNNILNFIEWSKSTYSTDVDDVFTNVNPMHFDNSVFDFYSSIFTGASLIPVNEALTRNPRKLIDALNKLQPTIWFSVPSMLVYILKMRALKEEDLADLRIVTFGGEGFPKNQLRKLWSFWGKRVKFINVYGPTECTCICSSYEVSEADMENDELLPLGPIAPNFYSLIIDENNNPVPFGETGELCIGGPNVGLGYFNNFEKTREVFIQNPKIDSHREIVYKSGDMVKHDFKTNLLYFSGRKDNQIKRMGYRIELEEIEAAIGSLQYVNENAVIYLNNEKYQEKIIACISSDVHEESKYIEDLSKLLPSYMMPNFYYFYSQLPKNQNGKIDRLKLKEDY